ncbi:hypothetical protein HT578_09070 [Novosphingobium decolorationis]|uniref:Rieske domain-containing protein n=1 Tax=Novosphingobium decolorationis TaxID=2698673 RepID=A0ABX8E4G5_9SPHN|nr:hypothetical protein HT578_09070 [Novosphingobium decolorationis]
MNIHQRTIPRDDGTVLEDLCDRVERGLERGTLPVEVFADDAVFRAEVDRIFTRAWVFVAHESELPKNGDYVLRKIGLDNVIVTRSSKGEFSVLLNHCWSALRKLVQFWREPERA